MSANALITEFGGLKDNYFRRNLYFKRDELFADKVDSFIKDFNNTDVYYSIYNYSDDNINECYLSGPLYLDFDINNLEENYKTIRREVYQTIRYFERVWKIPSKLVKIYFSGYKGFHLIINNHLFGVNNYDSGLNLKYKILAKLIQKECGLTTLDIKVYDRKRLFRMPNSINGKSGLYKVNISLETLMSSSLLDIQRIAQQPTVEENTTYPLILEAMKYYQYLFTPVKKAIKKQKNIVVTPDKTKKLLPCIVDILEAGIDEGKRNNTTIALVSSLFQSGRDIKQVREIILKWNKFNNPPLNEREVNTTISSGYNMFKSKRYYGCNSIQELGLCLGIKCPLKNVLKK